MATSKQKLQAAFDHVLTNLLKQGRRSVGWGEDIACAYFSDNGDKCGIGWLLDEARYDRSIEGMCVSRRRVRACLADEFKGLPVAFLSGVQRAHDTAIGNGFVSQLRREMADIAEAFGLLSPDGGSRKPGSDSLR
jgi:hypothetical protein